jgi:hypothetical protein
VKVTELLRASVLGVTPRTSLKKASTYFSKKRLHPGPRPWLM